MYFGTPLPLPLKNHKNTQKTRGWGVGFFVNPCLSHLLFVVCLLAVWFAYAKVPWLMLLIVPVRMQVSRCMGLGLVSWDIMIPAGVRLLVVLTMEKKKETESCFVIVL
jgi:hypothetical protein